MYRRRKRWAVLIGIILLAAVALAIGLFFQQSAGGEDSSHSGGQQTGLQKVDQKPVPDSSSSELSSSISTDSSQAQPESEQPDDSRTGTQDPPVTETGSIRGTVVDAATSTVIIQTEDTGEELYFMRESADVVGELVIGAKVEIYYNGALKDGNSLDLYVTKIVCEPT